jgi:integrase
LLFRLLVETGLRVGETLGLHVDDLNLTVGDEHISVTGKAGRHRMVLLDEPRLVAELRRYLKATGYTHGPIFRAEKNGVGGPLRYSTVQEHWARYTAAAGVSATCISSDTPTPPNSSTAASACPPFANASDTRTSRPPFATPNNPTATADAELRAWRRARA